MRRKAKVDLNQLPVTKVLRENGYKVLILSMIGEGKPDLLVSKFGVMALVELKKDNKSNLTPLEEEFFENYDGGNLIVCHLASQIVLYMLTIHETLYKQNDFVYNAFLRDLKQITEFEGTYVSNTKLE